VVATPTRGKAAIVSSGEAVEKERNLRQHRVEAQIDDGLMTWGYSCVFG